MRGSARAGPRARTNRPRTVGRTGSIAPARMTVAAVLWLTTALSAGPPVSDTIGPDPSLCPIVHSECHVVGSRVSATFTKGAGDPVVVGGQFTFHFDPTELQLMSIHPGSHCDAASPFSQELFSSVDEATGEAFYAVGVALGAAGTSEPAAMACAEFLLLQPQSGDLCVISDLAASFLVDNAGNPITIDNSIECPGTPASPSASCGTVDVTEGCACPGNGPDCGFWDSACTLGVCGEQPAHCHPVPVNEGAGCDDGIACTTGDTCMEGECRGSGCTEQSLCVVTGSGCQTDGGKLMRVVMGFGEASIVGGQFSIRYDAGALTLLDVSPGATCDPDSPFALEIDERVNHFTGEVFYAAGVDFLEGAGGTQGPATVACLYFAAEGQGQGEVCVLGGVNPSETILVDGTGHVVQVYNQEDCPSDSPGDGLSCGTMTWDATCHCTPGTDDCSALSTDCRIGVCDIQSERCGVEFVNEGGGCDDDRACTTHDVCLSGRCRGFGCRDPSLCLGVNQCPTSTGAGEIAILIGGGDAVISGGQFTVRYDPAELDFVDIVPGAMCDHRSPFASELHQVVDEANGEIFYAVGVDPVEGSGTSEPATLACVRFNGPIFTPSGVCLLRGFNPFTTLLVDEHGQSIEINTADCPGDYPDPIMTCLEFCDVPAASSWSLIILAMCLLTAAKLQLRRGAAASR